MICSGWSLFNGFMTKFFDAGQLTYDRYVNETKHQAYALGGKSYGAFLRDESCRASEVRIG